MSCNTLLMHKSNTTCLDCHVLTDYCMLFFNSIHLYVVSRGMSNPKLVSTMGVSGLEVLLLALVWLEVSTTTWLNTNNNTETILKNVNV